MDQKRKTFLIILMLFGFIGLAYVTYASLASQMGMEGDTTGLQDTREQERIEAPNFTVYDQDDQKVNLAEFFGKPIVLNFWASWCPPCVNEMPDFERAYQMLHDEVHFVMINMTDGRRETKQNALNFIETNGYTFPVFFDIDRNAGYEYAVMTIPTTYFIDAEGYVATAARGAINKELIMRGLEIAGYEYDLQK